MTRIQVILLVLFFLGIAWPGFWIIAVVLFEVYVKHGRTILAGWLASKMDTPFRGH